MHNLLGQGSFWIVNKKLTEIVGLEGALLLSDMVSKHDYFKSKGELSSDGYFFNTSRRIVTDTGLSYRKQKRVLTVLEDEGLLQTKLEGVPARLYFKLNFGKISSILGMDTKDGGKEQVATALKRPKKNPYVDLFPDAPTRAKAILEVYTMYPSRCVVRGASTSKGTKDKEKIERLLRSNSTEDLKAVIKWYIKECEKNQVYMKNFSTFLNNLPDLPKEVEDAPNNKEIKKLVRFLSGGYMFKSADERSDKTAKRLMELGYDNQEFLNRFLL